TGAPGGDGVREGHPTAAVDEAAAVEVATVHDHPAADPVVLDLEQLDAEVAGKAPLQNLGSELRSYLEVRLGHVRSALEGRGAEIAERLVALSHRLFEAGLRGPLLEGVSLPGVPGDPVEHGAQDLGR